MPYIAGTVYKWKPPGEDLKKLPPGVLERLQAGTFGPEDFNALPSAKQQIVQDSEFFSQVSEGIVDHLEQERYGNIAARTPIAKHDVISALKATDRDVDAATQRFVPSCDPFASHADLTGRVVFVTGASRGIGEAIAVRCASKGASVVVAAQSTSNNPNIPGTIWTAQKACEEMGAPGTRHLALKVDLLDESAIAAALDQAHKELGGFDVLVNNASTHWPYQVMHTDAKRFDLMNNVNVRGMFVTTRLAIPHLLTSTNPHVLTIAPAPVPDPSWVEPHACYSASKMAMAYLSMGFEFEFRFKLGHRIAFNTLWPRWAVSTAAVAFIGGPSMIAMSRTVATVADAAYRVLVTPSEMFSGNFVVDDDVVHACRIDPQKYKVTPSSKVLSRDFMLDREAPLCGFEPPESFCLPDSDDTLNGKNVVVVGGEFGPGLAFAKRAAQDGAAIFVIADHADPPRRERSWKTKAPDPDWEHPGYRALRILEGEGASKVRMEVTDLTFQEELERVIERAKDFLDDCIDVFVWACEPKWEEVRTTQETDAKRFDRLFGLTARAHFFALRDACYHMKENWERPTVPHFLSIVPPPVADGAHYTPHCLYTLCTHMRGLHVLGAMHEEEICTGQKPEIGLMAEAEIAVNALWPAKAVQWMHQAEEDERFPARRMRRPEVLGDAAYLMVTRDGSQFRRHFVTDEAVLAAHGVKDLSPYMCDHGADESELAPASFVERQSHYGCADELARQRGQSVRTTLEGDASLPGFSSPSMHLPDQRDWLAGIAEVET
mmetsp:Transcript_179/g.549  ORF Transcript_179/g.549 Transcript_179/m.549 type:complete len:775 (+) Transcript_179:200-2524(+)